MNLEKTGMKTTAIILAAGSGRRMGASQNKVYMTLCDKPVLAYTLAAFENSKVIDDIIVVAAPGEDAAARELALLYAPQKFGKVVAGGAERSDSVRAALAALDSDVQLVAIHDGARPLVSADLIERVWQEAQREGLCGAVPVLPLTDTVKVVDNGIVCATLDRAALRCVQTPQVFDKSFISAAYADLKQSVTDDASCAELLGGKVGTVYGDVRNIKLTVPFDVRIAQFFLELSGGNK